MNSNANFKVDPRLAALLGENYRSTELAIKELIDNAYDADADHVWVTLPQPLTNDPILIADDGTGMTENEVRNEYLNIASSRVSRKGERTKLKNRLVKGRKGIGKFAGLMVASLMEVRTRTRGKETYLKIWRDELIRAKNDLEQVNLPIETTLCDPEKSGTEITLSGINQNFTFPNAEKLKRILVMEYGRLSDFQIYVDGERVDIEDIPGDNFENEFTLENGETIQLRYTISDGRKPLRQSGIAIRVGGKIVGQPRFFGLEENEDIPPKLLKRIYGEIVADSLEADVTADWGSVIENSIVLEEIYNRLRPLLEISFREIYDREVSLTKIRLKKRIDTGLSLLPPYRRAYARKVMDKVLRKFYGESEARVGAVISVLLDSFEKNDYWMVMQNFEESRKGEVEDLTHAFTEFGMLDLAMIGQQSTHRLSIIKDIEKLIFHPDTTLNQIRIALTNNLWMLGNPNSLVSTNTELQQVVDMYVRHKFTNGHAIHAPNLLLLQDFNKGFVLLDLKSPDHTLEINDRRRAKEFQADLQVYLPGRDIDVIVIGGALSPGMVGQKASADIRFMSYKGMLSDAKVQLNWLIGELEKR
ncbi:MAG: ATP-binding protein [Bacteroidia bacterium]|nr:ATP-binding protein [Bacteroidia bacterium]